MAFHARSAYRAFQELGGIRLKDLKDHKNNNGGTWRSDTWANQVKDDVDKEFGEDEIQTGIVEIKSKNDSSQSLFLFPDHQNLGLE